MYCGIKNYGDTSLTLSTASGIVARTTRDCILKFFMSQYSETLENLVYS